MGDLYALPCILDHMTFAVYIAVSFIRFLVVFWFPFFNHCTYGCMFCMLLFNFVKLCIRIVMYVPFEVFCFIVSFCVLFACTCVLYCCHRVSTQLNISYRITLGKTPRDAPSARRHTTFTRERHP